MDTVISLLSEGSVAATSQLLKDPSTSKYGYQPTKYVCIIFLVLFVIALAAYVFYAIRYRFAWIVPTMIIACICEILGWATRLQSSNDPFNETPYKIQIVATIVGPTPFLAAIFLIFGYIVRIVGPEFSRLSPTIYSYLFVTFDIVSLVVQGTGGGLAAAGATLEKANKGGKIMLGGISLQLAIIVIFISMSSDVFIRLYGNHPCRGPPTTRKYPALETNMLVMVCALYLSVTFLLIRAVYRVIELSDGWHGSIIRTQVWFNVFDGAMVVLAMYTLIFVHPAVFIRKEISDLENKTKDSMELPSLEN